MPDNQTPYDNGATYRVRLSRPIVIGRAKLLPLHVQEMSGDFLNRLIEQEGSDAVDSAIAR